MLKTNRPDSGFSVIELVFILVILIVLVLVGYILLDRGSKTTPTLTPSSTSPTSNPYAVLSPATVPSKTAECTQQLSFNSDGSSGPYQCANGDLNATEWKALSALEPKVMTLGYSATAAQVQATICSDTNANLSNAIETNAYNISALYYGWSFNPSPTSVLADGSC